MSYTYPEALAAFESIAGDFMKILRPGVYSPVTVVCDTRATTASVAWGHWGVKIHMPVRAAASVMTQAEFEDWVAYLLHEMGHPTHTCKATWENACRVGLGRLTNALEDVREEKAVIASGIVPNAKAVLSRLISRKVVEARANGWKPNSRREFGWTICVLGRAANGYALDASDMAWLKSQIKPGSTVATILGWALPVLDACQSTADCVALADRIAKALAATAPVNGNPNPNENGDGGDSEGEDSEGEGEQGAGESEGGQNGDGEEGEGEGTDGPSGSQEGPQGEGEEGEGEGADGPSGSQDAPEGPSEGNEGESEGGKGGRGHGDGSTDADETPVTNEGELSEHGLAPESETLTGTEASAEKYVIDILRDQVIKSQPKPDPVNPRRSNPNGERLREAAAKASRQRALLARALRANETDEREGGKRAGRLDRGALSRAVSGSRNVFQRRDISEGFDTDVAILLDASGSMGGSNMFQALQVGLIVAQAASSVGACCTTETFNSSGYARAGGLASKRVPNPADYGVLVNGATGGTPLSAHMARAALAQAKRAGHKRRVLFVVTDGACDYGPATVKRMAGYLEKTCGTILAHVSIGTSLAGAFRAEVQVPYGVEVSDVGLEHFVKVLQAL